MTGIEWVLFRMPDLVQVPDKFGAGAEVSQAVRSEPKIDGQRRASDEARIVDKLKCGATASADLANGRDGKLVPGL